MTALEFGPVVLGGNTFGWTSDRDESFAVLDAFVGEGGVAIDTSDNYSAWVPGNVGGESETIIGEWLRSRGRPESLVIATKVFSAPARPGLSVANIRGAIDDSLRRLQSDHVDLYYAHHDDPSVDQAEYVGVLDELVRAGKVREIGVSNFSADRLRSAAAIAEASGRTAFTVSQDHYNLVHRDIEKTLLPTLIELGIVELPYYSLASGFLTGKYRPGARIASARAEGAGQYLELPQNLALLDVLDELARSHSTSVSAVALAWLRRQPGVAAPIASARTPEQLAALLQSATLTLSDEELHRLGLLNAPSDTRVGT